MIAMDVREQFERYAKLKVEEKKIKAEIESLAPMILGEVPDGESIDLSGYGTFTSKRRTEWLYSTELQVAEEEVKSRRFREQQDGTAIEKPGTPFLEFRATKA